MAAGSSLHPGAHGVHFYRDDGDLVRVVVDQLADAIGEAEPVIVIAEALHRDAFTAGLVARGVDLAAAEAAGLVIWRDATTTAERLLVEGSIDRVAFVSAVESLVRDAAGCGDVVHVYGEIVAVLWAAGEVLAAMELERLWNELLRDVPISLLCGYPAGLMTEAESLANYAEVRAEHEHVVAAAPADLSADVAGYFPAAPGSARHARRFVAQTLQSWDCSAIVDRAELIVSELVTNAIRHARSEAVVSLTRRGDWVEIVVGDTASAPPSPRTCAPDEAHGRGLLLVAALSSRWGHRLAPVGKFVWAQIELHR